MTTRLVPLEGIGLVTLKADAYDAPVGYAESSLAHARASAKHLSTELLPLLLGELACLTASLKPIG